MDLSSSPVGQTNLQYGLGTNMLSTIVTTANAVSVHEADCQMKTANSS